MTPRQQVVQMMRDDPGLADRIVKTFQPQPTRRILSPRDSLPVLLPILLGLDNERLVVIALDRSNRVTDTEVLTTGSDGFTVVCSRQVLRWVFSRQRPVSALIIAHNHPSGDRTPSPQDITITRRLAEAVRAAGINLLDHIIVAGESDWTSIRDLRGDDGMFDPVSSSGYHTGPKA